MAAGRAAVRDALADVEAGQVVLVGVSGGADSLALAASLAFVGPRAGWDVRAVVVDHGLQAGSGQVAERAGTQCRDLGLAA
ncbi:ATP-binding protein, partial [Aeromicrobium alkaliterrae]|uniref:ATP-binding protein n=1 Tax=Aeromicrobium alkaliterrae TaxID=302168 RepID=UPI0031D7C291